MEPLDQWPYEVDADLIEWSLNIPESILSRFRTSVSHMEIADAHYLVCVCVFFFFSLFYVYIQYSSGNLQ